MNRTTARRMVFSYIEEPACRLLVMLGFSPNTVTLLGLVGAIGSASLLGLGYMLAGGVALMISGVFDLLDGALARASHRTSSFGALLDSVVDRISEAIVLLGLLLFYVQQVNDVGIVLVFLALVGSVMVSYLRARAEGLEIQSKVGIMTRPERVVVLGVGLVMGHWWPMVILIALGTIAGLTALTSVQRLVHIREMLKSQK